MDLVEMMKAAGFKPTASTEGEWQPYDGYYKVALASFDVKSTKKDGTPCAKFGVVEFKVEETLSGKAPKEGTSRNEFSTFITLEGDQALDKKKGLPFIVSGIFTACAEDVLGINEEETYKNIQNKIGLSLFIHAFPKKSWKLTGTDASGKNVFVEDTEAAPKQGFSFVKEVVARKKAGATPF